MTSNINGNALTLEQKVKRKYEAQFELLEGYSSFKIHRMFNDLNNSELLELISEALEEMFEPIGHRK